jgi:hypothetical protein
LASITSRRWGVADLERGSRTVEVVAPPVTWVGMDVHVSSIAVAATISETGELRQAKLAGDIGQAVHWARCLPGEVRVTYTILGQAVGLGLVGDLALD